MISTGVVRKIDDLGRIVIPKEIRKNLGIRDGENLEIIVDGDNIRLTKNNIINRYLEDTKNLLLTAELLFPGTILITDREKVLFISGKELLNIGDIISSELMKMIDGRDIYNDNNILRHVIGNNELIGYFIIYPIIDEGNSLGLIILFDDKHSIKEYDILARYLSLLVSKKVDIKW